MKESSDTSSERSSISLFKEYFNVNNSETKEVWFLSVSNRNSFNGNIFGKKEKIYYQIGKEIKQLDQNSCPVLLIYFKKCSTYSA